MRHELFSARDRSGQSRISFDNRILWLLMEDLEAQLSIEGARLADAGRREYGNRTGEGRLAL